MVTELSILSSTNNYDVIIIGLGGMGSAAAYHLAERRVRVLGLDRFGPPHDLGSSHGSSRIIRQAYFEHPDYVPLLQRSYALWHQLVENSGRSDLIRLTGGLMLGSENSPVVRGTLESARQHGLPHEVFDAAELRRRFGPLHPRESDVGVYETKAGFVRPEVTVETHLELAQRHGAELHFNEPVKEWNTNGGSSVEVSTANSTYRAQKLILAPGAWAPELLTSLEVPFDVRRHVMCWFEPSGGVRPFLPERFPVYLWDVDERNIFYGFPATDGLENGAKVAMHTDGARCTPQTIQREITGADADELRHHLKTLIPALNAPLLRATTCMYTLTPDEHFVLGLHPQHSQVAVAAGFSGHGFKFVPVIGEILADLAVDGQTRHPIDLFAPNRFVRA